MVIFLPSFWLLTPGALTFISLEEIVRRHQAGAWDLLAGFFAIASMAFGGLVGWVVCRGLFEHARR